MEFDDKLAQAACDEAKRRGLVVTVTCVDYEEVFLNQEVSYVIEHGKVCPAKARKPLPDLRKPSNSDQIRSKMD